MTAVVRKLLAFLLVLSPLPALAQPVTVTVEVSGNSALVRIGGSVAPLADLRLDFDDASGLSAASLGVSAELVDPAAAALLSRLPAGGGALVPAELPLMITIEPSTFGGLSFRRVVHVELHTHALVYTAGSRYRLLKAPLGGTFRDITGSVTAGSVRTRGTTGGFSQFLVVLDARPTLDVVSGKLARLRAEAAKLPALEAAPLQAQLDAIEAGLGDERYADAIGVAEAMRQRVSARAGLAIPQEWRALRDRDNIAGELLAGLDTLVFSIGYLRDHGD
ncbi:DUF6689 family protein [Arenimonas sp.]|uniref:DUF6689 family protein n=1 Tax=Arenimonas sp. TaxID=1872635 RepID=UPI002E37C6D6|nr:DUF6689 family protein [Arenimonas sp.]HEX4852993.1 DUF6689 family protein [Arenimonas sp.]